MISKNIKKNFLINLFIVLFIFFLDRFSKIYVIYLNDKLIGPEIFNSKFLNIQLIWNEGVAFGLFAFNNEIYYNSLTVLILLITIVILYFIIKASGIDKYGFIMILGGSLGNIFDRLFYSSVPDFIDIHFYNFHWFIFNVADIFITIGVLLLIYVELIKKNKKIL